MNLFKYARSVDCNKPRPLEIVILLDMNDEYSKKTEYSSGVPITFGYWDAEKEKWFDGRWFGKSSEDFDFRDMRNNISMTSSLNPTHWIEDTALSALFSNIKE